eukprot:scaffold32245_cov49-Prasinocladus_malaysianus.AAC.1
MTTTYMLYMLTFQRQNAQTDVRKLTPESFQRHQSPPPSRGSARDLSRAVMASIPISPIKLERRSRSTANRFSLGNDVANAGVFAADLPPAGIGAALCSALTSQLQPAKREPHGELQQQPYSGTPNHVLAAQLQRTRTRSGDNPTRTSARDGLLLRRIRKSYGFGTIRVLLSPGGVDPVAAVVR